MLAWSTTGAWVSGAVAVAIAVVVGGCCPRDASGSRAPTVIRATEPTPPRSVYEPSPALQLVREERLAMEPPAKAPTIAPSAAEQDEGAGAQTDGQAGEHVEFVEGETRRVRVRTRVLASLEDLVRAAIRQSQDRRPEFLYVSRLLLRIAGVVCDCDGSVAEQIRVRKLIGELVVRARPALKGCLAADAAEDPRVVIKAPALLVIEQVRRFDPMIYRWRPALEVSPMGIVVHDLGWKGASLDDNLAACLERALEATDVDTSEVTQAHRVTLPLVAFSQPGFAFEVSNLHHVLAVQASMLGWLYYENGAYAEALEYFRDAYWVFRMDEFRYLIAMSLERLGDHRAAAEHYEAYLAARPYAPEAPTLPAHIELLRGTTIAQK
jgi:tetratricopeptide (TPR) repeat protein